MDRNADPLQAARLTLLSGHSERQPDDLAEPERRRWQAREREPHTFTARSVEWETHAD